MPPKTLNRLKLLTEIKKPTKPVTEFRRFHSSGVNEIWTADIGYLIDFPDGQYKYILFIMDAYSRYLLGLYPLKTTTSKEIIPHFETLFKGQTPKLLWTDEGSEFTSKEFKSLVAKYNIQMYSTHSDNKAFLVERLIKTIKTWIYNKINELGKSNWTKWLPEILQRYNTKYHRGIRNKPENVYMNDLQTYKPPMVEPKKPKFKVGDHVRIAVKKEKFDRNWDSKWSSEVFEINKIITDRPPYYQIKDYTGEIIKSGFYEPELQKTDFPLDYFLVDKIVKKKPKESLVKWVGYTDKHNSWVSNKDIANVS